MQKYGQKVSSKIFTKALLFNFMEKLSEKKISENLYWLSYIFKKLLPPTIKITPKNE